MSFYFFNSDYTLCYWILPGCVVFSVHSLVFRSVFWF